MFVVDMKHLLYIDYCFKIASVMYVCIEYVCS